MPNRTVAGTLRQAFLAAITAAVTDPAVQIVTGRPWPELADDIISVGKVRSHQEPKTFGSGRGFEETLTVEVLVSVFRRGGQEVENTAHARAFELLGLIEHKMRLEDTTVGGTVLWCWLTDSDHDSEPFTSDTTDGRVTEILATFTAMVRITN